MNVNRVRQLAHQYMNYDMIQRYTELPPFPGSQIRLMLSFLRPDLQHNRRSELYMLVTSLVQVGLDAHDQIEAQDREGTGTQHMRSKQLKVLAGDYFSGRYYELLAIAEDVSAIGTLSDAISDVNLLKMNHYMRKQQRDLSGEQYLQQLLAIRTRLFLAFETDIAAEYRTVWRELLDSYTMYQIMRNEHALLADMPGDYDGWAVWEILHTVSGQERALFVMSMDKPDHLDEWIDKYRLTERLDHMLEDTAGRFMRHAESMRAERLFEEAVMPLMEDVRHQASRQYTYD